MQQIESYHKHSIIDHKNYEPLSLNINEGTGSRTKQNYKFKSDLVTRYSEELEEENKHLKELLRLKNNSADSSNHVIIGTSAVPARNFNHKDTNQSVPLFTPYDRLMSECLPATYKAKAERTKADDKFVSSAGSEAWLKMRKISFEIERSEQEKRKESHPVKIVNLARDIEACVSTKKKETDAAIDNTLDLISFSSEFSFSSGYRSSNYEENIESEVETIETVQGEVVKTNSKADMTDILGGVIDKLENSVNYLELFNKENHNPLHVVKDSSLSIGLDEKEDSDQNKVFTLVDEDETDLQQTVSNSPTCNKTKIMNTMEENENIKFEEEQESGDSLASQNSTVLPDLESFGEESYNKENKFVEFI